jgi:hypothetical protein
MKKAILALEKHCRKYQNVDFAFLHSLPKRLKPNRRGDIRVPAGNKEIELHRNQYLPAAVLICHLKSGKKMILLSSPVQTGKMGIITSVGLLSIYDKDLRRRHKFFISPLPYRQNKNQDKERLQGTNITYIAKKDIKNFITGKMSFPPYSILSIDESHWGMKEGDTVPHLEALALHNPTCQIIYVSATPYPQTFSKKFKEVADYLHVPYELHQEQGYVGYNEMAKKELVNDNLGLPAIFKIGRNKARWEINPTFQENIHLFRRQKDRKVSIVRCSNTATSEALEQWVKDNYPDMYVVNCSSSGEDYRYLDADNLGKIVKHTLIIIKGYCRVGYTIQDTRNIYSLWEVGSNQTTIVQGLIARCLGYRGKTNDGLNLYIHMAEMNRYDQFCRFGHLPEGGKPHALVRALYSSTQGLSIPSDCTQELLPEIRKLRSTAKEKLNGVQLKALTRRQAVYKDTLRALLKKNGKKIFGRNIESPWIAFSSTNKEHRKFHLNERATFPGSHGGREDAVVSVDDLGRTFKIFISFPETRDSIFGTKETSAHSAEVLQQREALGANLRIANLPVGKAR